MDDFQLNKQALIALVSAAQTRTYAEQIQHLVQKSNDLRWLIDGVNSHDKKGISNEPSSLELRTKTYGSNQKAKKQLTTFCQLMYEALDDFIEKILIVSSIVSIGISVGMAEPDNRSTAWIQGFVILIAVFICALVTASNNYSKERQFQYLNKVADQRKKLTVKRNNELIELHQDDLLVGDIANVAEGMEIPADAILIQSNQISTDQSAMTGQSDPMNKNVLEACIKVKQEIEQRGEKNTAGKHEVPSPILLSGTKVLTGEGKMMILVVGESSCIGKIRALLEQQEQTLTPLQEKLQSLAKKIGKFGLISAIVIIVVLLLRFGIEKGVKKDWNTSSDVKQLIGYFILGLTVIVVAIPEGLPLSVTLTLAVSVKKMLADNNLVRKMQACQTMGGANNICSDKTGTLTMNKMTMAQMWNGVNIKLNQYDDKIDLSQITTNKEWTELFTINGCVNSTANLLPEEKGSSTEVSILKFLSKCGIKYSEYREQFPAFVKFPFSSSRKRMSVIIERNRQNYIFVKGASQIVLNSCNKWYDMKSNKIDIISQSVKANMDQCINKMAESSLRTLCLAYKTINQTADISSKDEKGIFNIEKGDLILIAIIGVRDIPRKQVPSAIQKCHKAGITVRMVTGDNLITAKAIAKDVGIIRENDDSIVMQGQDFISLIGGVVCKTCKIAVCDCARDLKTAEAEKKPLRVDTIKNGQQFDRIKDKLMVLARSRPEDKYALVTGLKERGCIVAVTGDGTNDAPALKKADVGFAMGITGTEVAREAASIILLDDNFNSIVRAVIWGRNIYDCIRKFIQFQLTVNLVAVAITLISGSLIKQQVLAPIQMLWINLIMDTLASLALASETPTQKLLERKPINRSQSIISKHMIKHIVGQATFQLIVLLILIFAGEHLIPQYKDALDTGLGAIATNPGYKWHNGVIGGTVRSGRLVTILGDDDYQKIFKETDIVSRHFTFIFNTFVMMQIFNFFNSRKIHEEFNIFGDILSNKLFIIIVGIIFGLQIVLISFSGKAFQVYANYGLTYQQWFISIGIGFISWPICFLLKLLRISDQEGEDEGSKEQSGKEQMSSGTMMIKVKQLKEFPSPKFQPLSQVSKMSEGRAN